MLQYASIKFNSTLYSIVLKYLLPCDAKYYNYEIMNIENTKAQMRKGILEYCVLNHLEQHSAYASDILDALKEAELIVVEGTIYPLLTRLKNADLLEYHWEESSGGPPRKYYQISDTGRNFKVELDNTWTTLKNAVEITQKNKSHE